MAHLRRKARGKSEWTKIHDEIQKADAMRTKNNTNQAKKCFIGAQEMNKELQDEYLEALILEGLGLCHTASDDYEKAIRIVTDSIAMFKKLPGPEGRLGHANGLLRFGEIYIGLGKYNKAIEYQEEAIEMLLKMRKEYPRHTRGQRKKKTIKKSTKLCPEDIAQKTERVLGAAYGDMAYTCNELGEYKKALDLCKEALDINEKFADKFETAKNMLNMGNSYNKLNKPEQSIEFCEKSVRIFKEIGDKKGASTCYGILAPAYLALGDIEKSQRYFQMCIDINNDMKQYADLAIVHGNNGHLDYEIGLEKFLSFGGGKQYLENSVQSYKLAIESSDNVLTRLSVDKNRTAFSDRFYRWYDELTAPFNLLGRSAAALLFLDLGRAKILRQLVYKHVSFQENHDGELAFESSWSTIENKKERERISTLSKKIQLLESDATVLFYNFNRAQILTIWVLDAKGRVSLKTTDPSSNFLTAQDELEDNVEMVLDSASVVLPRAYRFFNHSAVVNAKAQDKNAKASHDDKEVKDSKTKRDLRSPAKTGDNPCQDLTKETRSSLYRSLINPVKSFIKGTKLIIVPQRSLFFAPFSSFIDENGCVLSEKYQIQIIPSIHVLAMSIQSSSGKPIGNSLFVGDPDVTGAGLPRLPCAAEEVEYLASLVDSKPLLGAMATKKNVLEVIPEASIIHIAAHGDEKTGHIFLALETSKSPAHQTSSSYVLTQSDILKCKLTARLVVLSCCNTGKGQVSSEGVLGIARSFLGAGASSVLVTLWRINDMFTKLFMTVFFKKILEEKSVCLALKETMNEFQRNGEYKSFKFWAAFEILGEDVRFSKEDIEEIRQNNKLKNEI